MNEIILRLNDLLHAAAQQPLVVAGASLAVLVAALLRGLTGFGFALAAVPLLSLVVVPIIAVPLVVCLQMFSNLFEVRASLKHCHWHSQNWLMIGAAIGSPIGVLALSLISAPQARVAIAAATAMAVIMLWRGFSLSAVPKAAMTVPVGFVAGLFNGLAAMPGPPVIAYYMSTPLSRVAIRASLNIFFLINAVVALASAAWLGLISIDIVIVTLIALPLVFVGQWIGHQFFKWGSDSTHRRIAIAALAVIAAGAAIRGFAQLF